MPAALQPSRRCPHGIDHPSWCPICRVHWQARMRHPSWPREPAPPPPAPVRPAN